MQFAGVSGGPIGKRWKTQGDPLPTEFDPQQIRVPKSNSVLGVYFAMLVILLLLISDS